MIFTVRCEPRLMAVCRYMVLPAPGGRPPLQEARQRPSRRQEPATADNERTASGNQHTINGNEWQHCLKGKTAGLLLQAYYITIKTATERRSGWSWSGAAGGGTYRDAL